MKRIQKTVAYVVAVCVVVVGIGIWMSYYISTKTGEVILPKPRAEKPPKAEAVTVGYGWSIKSNERDAVAEAISKVKTQLGDKSPEYALLFCTVDYDEEKVLNEVRKLLGSDTQIYGGTSCLAVQTKDGFHVGEHGSLSLLAVSCENIAFGVGGVSIDDFSSPRAAGKAAIQAAMDASGEKGLPKLVLVTGSVGVEEDLLKGIEDVIGSNIPVIGGSAADNDISGEWKQFANDKVYSNGVSLTAIYTNLKIGWAFEHGYLKTENRGMITKAEGRVIYEIGGQPAAEVYNNWTGGLVSEELTRGGSVLTKTTFYPLAKVIKEGTTEYTISIHPLSVNASDHSLTVFANIEDGDEVLLMHGDWELLLNRALTTPTKALENGSLSGEDVSFGIYTYCAGTMLAIPETERPKMPSLVRSVIGDAPFIGTFTFGEQGYIKEIGNIHSNLANSMIIFQK